MPATPLLEARQKRRTVPAVIGANGEDAGGQGLSPNVVRIVTSDDPGRPLQGYLGAKAGAGVIQTIINNIPPCDTFIEAFAGTAFLTHSLRPARSRIVIDADAAVCDALRRSFVSPTTKLLEQMAWDFGSAEMNANATGLRIVRGDAVRWLETHRGQFNERTVIYLDPPYLVGRNGEARRRYYQYEFNTREQHAALLEVLSRLNAQGVPCLISHYRCALYDDLLAAWRRVDYTTGTRGGPVTESFWCNFEPPQALQDYRYFGHNFRERERLKRKRKRWRSKLVNMPPIERACIIEAVRDLIDGTGERTRAASPVTEGGL